VILLCDKSKPFYPKLSESSSLNQMSDIEHLGARIALSPLSLAGKISINSLNDSPKLPVALVEGQGHPAI